MTPGNVAVVMAPNLFPFDMCSSNMEKIGQDSAFSMKALQMLVKYQDILWSVSIQHVYIIIILSLLQSFSSSNMNYNLFPHFYCTLSTMFSRDKHDLHVIYTDICRIFLWWLGVNLPLTSLTLLYLFCLDSTVCYYWDTEEVWFSARITKQFSISCLTMGNI